MNLHERGSQSFWWYIITLPKSCPLNIVFYFSGNVNGLVLTNWSIEMTNKKSAFKCKRNDYYNFQTFINNIWNCIARWINWFILYFLRSENKLLQVHILLLQNIIFIGSFFWTFSLYFVILATVLFYRFRSESNITFIFVGIFFFF